MLAKVLLVFLKQLTIDFIMSKQVNFPTLLLFQLVDFANKTSEQLLALSNSQFINKSFFAANSMVCIQMTCP